MASHYRDSKMVAPFILNDPGVQQQITEATEAREERIRLRLEEREAARAARKVLALSRPKRNVKAKAQTQTETETSPRVYSATPPLKRSASLQGSGSSSQSRIRSRRLGQTLPPISATSFVKPYGGMGVTPPAGKGGVAKSSSASAGGGGGGGLHGGGKKASSPVVGKDSPDVKESIETNRENSGEIVRKNSGEILRKNTIEIVRKNSGNSVSLPVESPSPASPVVKAEIERADVPVLQLPVAPVELSAKDGSPGLSEATRRPEPSGTASPVDPEPAETVRVALSKSKSDDASSTASLDSPERGRTKPHIPKLPLYILTDGSATQTSSAPSSS
jgi:hypothetical protein